MQKYIILIILGLNLGINHLYGMEDPPEHQVRPEVKTPEFNQETQDLILRYCYAGQIDKLIKGVLKVRKTRAGDTTLHAVARSRNLKSVQLLTDLADRSMSVEEKSQFVNTKSSEFGGEISAFNTLFAHCIIGVLNEPESKKNAELLAHLFKHGVDPESTNNRSGETLLMQVVANGDLRCMKLIVEAIEQKHKNCKEAIHKALNAADDSKRTALNYAQECSVVFDEQSGGPGEAMIAYLKSKGVVAGIVTDDLDDY